jgi:uncharacterized protein YbjT (DUF2867 family)
MKIKAIITGSTGMIGRAVLLECLDNPYVSQVLVINRRSSSMKHEKLKQIIHEDLFNLSSIRNELSGYNTCFFCLGISSAGVSEDEYKHITYDLTLSIAKTLLEMNPGMTFCYISGAGTDSSEKGRSMWARIKGKTENALLDLKFKDSYMLRPAFIQPRKGVRSRTKMYNVIYTLMIPLYPAMKYLPKYFTDSVLLAKTMICVAQSGYDKKIIENAEINEIARKQPSVSG